MDQEWKFPKGYTFPFIRQLYSPSSPVISFILQLLRHHPEFCDDIYKITISIYIYVKDFSSNLSRNDSLEYSLPYLHCTSNINIGCCRFSM